LSDAAKPLRPFLPSACDFEAATRDHSGRTMERQGANLRTYCADVLRGDWSIYETARSWLEHPANA
jgi:hypothetical protein